MRYIEGKLCVTVKYMALSRHYNLGTIELIASLPLPTTTKDTQKDFVQTHFGYRDEWPIFCEPFWQWVIEDKFCNGHPHWDKCDNVTFVTYVAPYETMKLPKCPSNSKHQPPPPNSTLL